MKIVLFEPLIPQNTGSIARMCAATYTELHLVEPLGFELSDRYLKRAGLDYWNEVILRVHPNWESFLVSSAAEESQLWLLTKHATASYCECRFGGDDFLVFGSETKGFPQQLHERYQNRRFRIPMENPAVRSLNLATSAGIVLFEARRQNAPLR